MVSLVLQEELLLARPEAAQAEAEACFSEALAVPRRQQAKSRELYTVTSLVRLWRQQNRMQDAHELLACPFPGSHKKCCLAKDEQESQLMAALTTPEPSEPESSMPESVSAPSPAPPPDPHMEAINARWEEFEAHTVTSVCEGF